MVTKSKQKQELILSDRLSSVVDLFISRGEPQLPETITISARMPTQTLCKLDALASVAAVSRSAMVIELLELGIAATVAKLPLEILTDVETQYLENLEAAAKEGA